MKDDPLFRELPDSFDERVPPPPPPPPRVKKWDVATAVLIGLVVSSGILIGIVPKFADVYRQVKVPMPGMTLALMNLSDLACSYPIVLAFLMTMLAASVHAWNARAVSIARHAMPVLNLVVWGGMVYALFLPLLSCFCGIGPRR